MANRGWLGWVIAGVITLAWLTSDDEITSPAPSTSSQSIDRPDAQIDPKKRERRDLSPSVELSLQSPVTTLSAPEPAPVPYYTKANVRLRAGPSTSTAIVWTVPAGTEVLSITREAEWHKVSVRGYRGYIRGDFLTDNRPVFEKSRPAPLARRTPTRRSGEAVRDPYVGTCDCPYDLMRNGRSCGGRSAYSRPGGRSPVCYF